MGFDDILYFMTNLNLHTCQILYSRTVRYGYFFRTVKIRLRINHRHRRKTTGEHLRPRTNLNFYSHSWHFFWWCIGVYFLGVSGNRLYGDFRTRNLFSLHNNGCYFHLEIGFSRYYVPDTINKYIRCYTWLIFRNIPLRVLLHTFLWQPE